MLGRRKGSWMFGLVGLAAGLSEIARAYPIPPVPLWRLVEEADWVVLADVVEVTEPQDGVFRPEYVARLRILEVWKGQAPANIDVSFPAMMGCPAPPRYTPGRKVLAFLEQFEDQVRTVGLSYGTLYPAPGEAVDDFRELVTWAQLLPEDPALREAERVEWLVEAASRPPTRWHGLYELRPGYVQFLRGRPGPRDPVPVLRDWHWARLADSFVESPPTDRDLPLALTVLARLQDEEVSAAAVSAVEAILGQAENPWLLRSVLPLVWARYGDPTPDARLAALDAQNASARSDELTVEALREVWERSRTQLGIPRLPAAPISPEPPD